MKIKFGLFTLVRILFLFSFATFTFLFCQSLYLKKQVENTNKNRFVYKRFFQKFRKGDEGERSLAKLSLPKKLRNIPFGESNSLVLQTQKVTIRNMPAPYNASIIKYDSGYLMFFRYDVKKEHAYHSYIGCAELDSNFKQTDKEFTTINTYNDHSEDPRVFSVGDKTYLIYSVSEFNNIPPFGFTSTLNIAQIDLRTRNLQFVTDLELNFSLIEKSWGPFEYIDNQGVPSLYLQYRLNPHKILQLQNPRINHITHPIFSKSAVFQTIDWENEPFSWGELRGGTPALNIGNEYLAFFHTCFTDKDGLVWYSMGAYTFEARPPFRLTAISPHPILFNGIYESNFLNTAATHKIVIFPTGFTIEQKEGKELIQLFCGENDSVIKIITLDKETLLKGLKKI